MRVAVVGAGASGLTAAHRLSKLGHECDVYERRPYLGGQASTIELGGYRIERCPQYIRRGDERVRSLIAEVGLGAQLDWRKSSSGVFAGRSLRARAASLLRGDDAGESLGYPRSSWEVLWGRLAELIEESGGRVLIDRPVGRLAREGDGFSLSAPDARRYDAVVATIAAEALAAILEPGLVEAPLTSVQYRAASSLLLELDRPLTRRHRTRMTGVEPPFAVIVEQTNFIEPEHYGGRRFAYVVAHGPREHELFELDSDELLELYEPALRLVNPGFAVGWVRDRWLFREPNADAVSRPQAASSQTGVPGLLRASAALPRPSNATIDGAIAAAESVASHVGAAAG